MARSRRAGVGSGEGTPWLHLHDPERIRFERPGRLGSRLERLVTPPCRAPTAPDIGGCRLLVRSWRWISPFMPLPVTQAMRPASPSWSTPGSPWLTPRISTRRSSSGSPSDDKRDYWRRRFVIVRLSTYEPDGRERHFGFAQHAMIGDYVRFENRKLQSGAGARNRQGVLKGGFPRRIHHPLSGLDYGQSQLWSRPGSIIG